MNGHKRAQHETSDDNCHLEKGEIWALVAETSRVPDSNSVKRAFRGTPSHHLLDDTDVLVVPRDFHNQVDLPTPFQHSRMVLSQSSMMEAR